MFIIEGILLGTIACFCVNVTKECFKLSKRKSTIWKYEIGEDIIYTVDSKIVKGKIIKQRYYTDKKCYGEPCYYVRVGNNNIILLSEQQIKCTVKEFEI